jgi:hypothetical protein
MGRKSTGRRGRPRGEDTKAQITPPPLGGAGERPQPLEGESPEIARAYDPGFKPPDEDDDPWQDEGRPEASG